MKIWWLAWDAWLISMDKHCTSSTAACDRSSYKAQHYFICFRYINIQLHHLQETSYQYNREHMCVSLWWHNNGPNGVSNDQPPDCLLYHLFRCRSKKTSKLHVTGLCVGNSPGLNEFPTQMASNAENVSIWWCHHVTWNWEREMQLQSHTITKSLMS